MVKPLLRIRPTRPWVRPSRTSSKNGKIAKIAIKPTKKPFVKVALGLLANKKKNQSRGSAGV